ncbi:MerR family transcriptional regulator [Paenibacillus tarimensis]
MTIRPIDIARKLNISTSALRHYEEWGLIPPVKRGTNGYRIYTEEHVAYFECIRAFYPGFGMEVTREVLQKVRNREVDEAIWLFTGQQAKLHQDKIIAERTVQVLETKELDLLDAKGRKRYLTIGEVSKETSVPSTAIRHWEKAGLITIPRDQENGYRRFGTPQIRQVLVIHTLRKSIWSLDVIKQILLELEQNQIERARLIAQESLRNLNRINRDQHRGIYYFYRLCKLLKLVDDRWLPWIESFQSNEDGRQDS